MADTTAETVVEQPAVTADQAVDTASLAELDQLLAAQPITPVEETTAEPAIEPEQEQAEAEPEAEHDDEPAADDKPKGKQYRIRPNDSQEEAFLALKRSGKTVAEAYAAVYGTEKKPEPVAVKEEPKPVSPHDAAIETHTASIADLESKLKAAESDADLPAITAIMRQIGAAERALDKARDLKANEETAVVATKQSAAEIQRATAAQQDYDKAVSLFPELADPASPHAAKFAEFFAAAQRDPEYADLFERGNYRVQLAKDFALENGLVPAHRRTASAPSTKQASNAQSIAPVKQAVRPQASAATAISTKAAPTRGHDSPQLSEADIANMTVEQLDALLAVKPKR